MSANKRNLRLTLGLTLAAALACAMGLLVFGRGEHRPLPATAISVNEAAAKSKSLSASELFDQRYRPSRGGAASEVAEVAHISRGQVTLKFRAIGLNGASSDVTADQTLAQEVLKQIQSSSLFDQTTDFSGKLSDEESPGTFTFTIAAKVKRPLEL